MGTKGLQALRHSKCCQLQSFVVHPKLTIPGEAFLCPGMILSPSMTLALEDIPKKYSLQGWKLKA